MSTLHPLSQSRASFYKPFHASVIQQLEKGSSFSFWGAAETLEYYLGLSNEIHDIQSRVQYLR